MKQAAQVFAQALMSLTTPKCTTLCILLPYIADVLYGVCLSGVENQGETIRRVARSADKVLGFDRDF